MQALLYWLLPFVAAPPMAPIPAAVFGLWWFNHGRRAGSVLAAAILWAVYAAWEISFLFRPVREWIRVDLLLIAPVLLASTTAAAVAMYRSRR